MRRAQRAGMPGMSKIYHETKKS
ncbi:UNVERIFIED_CONTAM: hypothetical protein GTU68_019073 [Idotea baltica]|nr:hypothetical protein [Idotea baltica]